jgi:hypothetical protein
LWLADVETIEAAKAHYSDHARLARACQAKMDVFRRQIMGPLARGTPLRLGIKWEIKQSSRRFAR